MEATRTQLSAILAEAQAADPWTSRARPSFLYVMYAIILWAIPMGLIAAVRPEAALRIAAGMNAYLNGLPEPLTRSSALVISATPSRGNGAKAKASKNSCLDRRYSLTPALPLGVYGT